MKKLFLLVIVISVTQWGYAANVDTTAKKVDSLCKAQMDSLKSVKEGINTLGKQVGNIKANVDTLKSNGCKCIPTPNKANVRMSLVVIPFICFVLLFILIGLWLILSKFSINEALAENDIEKVTIANKQYSAENITLLLNAVSPNQLSPPDGMGSPPAQSANNNLNPATIVNIAGMVPPTIEVSNVPVATEKTIATLKEMINAAINAINNSKNATDAFNNADSKSKIAAANYHNAAEDKKNDAKKPADDAQKEADNLKIIADNLKNASDNANKAVDDAKKTAFNNFNTNEDILKALYTNGSDNVYRPSSSRLIAFITSMFTLVIAMSMSCFFIYQYMYTGCPPDMSAVTTLLITLGIGVTPYAFNKIAGAMKNNKSDS